MTSEFDQFTIVESVKAARRYAALPAWDGYVLEPYGDMGNATTDSEILAVARESVDIMFHPVSTARMSPKNASWGVLDPELLVKGTSGLRVVDAAALVSVRTHPYNAALSHFCPSQPAIPAVHPMAVIYVMAERAAQLIKDAWA